MEAATDAVLNLFRNMQALFWTRLDTLFFHNMRALFWTRLDTLFFHNMRALFWTRLDTLFFVTCEHFSTPRHALFS